MSKYFNFNYNNTIVMAHAFQPPGPESLSGSIHVMAKHVHEQSRLLLLDLSKGACADSLECRLGGLSGAVIQLENLLNSCRQVIGDEPIATPEDLNGY